MTVCRWKIEKVYAKIKNGVKNKRERALANRKGVLTMTKVDVISGFLGAGKTTFIKELINKVFVGEKLVLIENEFGEIGIDG